MRLRIVQETGYLKAELQARETAEEMVQEFGLSAFLEEMSNACRVALVGENQELRASDAYLATMAQHKQINVRAFRTETAAARWLRGATEPSRHYKLHRIVLAGAPNEPGVYALWQDDELIYYGRARASCCASTRKASATCRGRTRQPKLF